ncbi:MAG TPA: FkbM family methyltransferase [Roseiflexaceae bacterium]|nr:FkbM family methyltransferase [Roseiflexaceae bacterium]
MYQFVLDRSLSDRWSISIVFGLIRGAMIKYLGDETVRWSINGRSIVINFAHQLPYYMKGYPEYSRNISRIADFIRSRIGGLCMIDVGANVGDTVAMCGLKPDDKFFLVEGDPTYFALLKQNFANEHGVVLVHTMLSDRFGIQPGSLVAANGTARVEQGKGTSLNLHYTTLDLLAAAHGGLKDTNLLKVDVDGYDGRVLRGARQVIDWSHPILFFECSPRELEAAGDDALALLDDLSALGYRRFVFYDNLGYLLGVVSADSRDQLADLMFYSRQRPGYYYDILTFHVDQNSYLDQFLAQERRYYGNLSR